MTIGVCEWCGQKVLRLPDRGCPSCGASAGEGPPSARGVEGDGLEHPPPGRRRWWRRTKSGLRVAALLSRLLPMTLLPLGAAWMGRVCLVAAFHVLGGVTGTGGFGLREVLAGLGWFGVTVVWAYAVVWALRAYDRLQTVLPAPVPRHPYFLVLRPFQADRTLRLPADADGGAQRSLPPRRLYGALARRLPSVLVGDPHEILPPAGGPLLYLSDAEWKTRVGELMRDAALIGYCPGRTVGVAWEWQELRRRADPTRLVVLLFGPDVGKGYAALRVNALRGGLALPPAHPRLRAVAFGADWTPRALLGTQDEPWDGRVTRDLIRTLREWAAPTTARTPEYRPGLLQSLLSTTGVAGLTFAAFAAGAASLWLIVLFGWSPPWLPTRLP